MKRSSIEVCGHQGTDRISLYCETSGLDILPPVLYKTPLSRFGWLVELPRDNVTKVALLMLGIRLGAVK